MDIGVPLGDFHHRIAEILPLPAFHFNTGFRVPGMIIRTGGDDQTLFFGKVDHFLPVFRRIGSIDRFDAIQPVFLQINDYSGKFTEIRLGFEWVRQNCHAPCCMNHPDCVLCGAEIAWNDICIRIPKHFTSRNACSQFFVIRMKTIAQKVDHGIAICRCKFNSGYKPNPMR